MPQIREVSNLALTEVLRSAPTMAPEDSLQRFLETINYTTHSRLPVVRDGTLCGYIRRADTLFLLAIESPQDRQTAALESVSSRMQSPAISAPATMSQHDIGRVLSESLEDLIAVVDENNRYLGVVTSAALLSLERPPVRPPLVGGMATPFGVYLTDGKLQAGVGNVALVAAGAYLAILHQVSLLSVEGALALVSRLSHVRFPRFSPDYIAPPNRPDLAALALGFVFLTTALFLALIRFTRLAGYHAAEHQTVHAMEHGEALTAEVVARMPRPHPRCGTNLMGVGILYIYLGSLFELIPSVDPASAWLLAAIGTLCTWRRFGHFLQEKFTTRPARPQELASGIAAGTALTEQYRFNPPTRPKLLRRIWCAGFLQVVLGAVTTSWLLSTVLSIWRL